MSNIETNKLFIWNLHRHVRRPELKEFFSQWGEVEYANVSLDQETRRSRWFGFVTFASAEDAMRAKEEANEQELHGRTIYVDFAKAKENASEPENDNKIQDHEEEISTDEGATTDDATTTKTSDNETGATEEESEKENTEE